MVGPTASSESTKADVTLCVLHEQAALWKSSGSIHPASGPQPGTRQCSVAPLILNIAQQQSRTNDVFTRAIGLAIGSSLVVPVRAQHSPWSARRWISGQPPASIPMQNPVNLEEV